MSGTPQKDASGSDFGFDDALDDAASEFKDWQGGAATNDAKRPDPVATREAAQEAGFTSREAAPKKEPSDQVSIRAKKSVIDEFKAFCKAQEPEWPQGYALERAMAALKKELAG